MVDLDCHFEKLTDRDVDWLENPFSGEEVWEAIQSCDGSKAPGPDGFNLEFIKQFWSILRGGRDENF